MIVLVLFIVLAAVAGVLAFLLKKFGGAVSLNRAYLQFYARGQEAGFANKEIKLLYDLSKLSKTDNIQAIFWSQDKMDNCIKEVVKDFKKRGVLNNEENQNFLSRLYDFRKKLSLKMKGRGLMDTRDMEPMQTLQIVLQDKGIFVSKVIQVMARGLKILMPSTPDAPHTFEWKDNKIIVYFSRIDDANYCFESKVIDEIHSPVVDELLISHSTSLTRTQNRFSIRAKIHRPASLYPLEIAGNEKSKLVSKVRCFLEDVSDGGCAVSVGGTTSAGFRVVIQFTLDGTPITMNGVVRSVQYDKKSNTSLLHIQSDLMPENVRNLITGIVLGVVEEDEAGAAAAGAGGEGGEKYKADEIKFQGSYDPEIVEKAPHPASPPPSGVQAEAAVAAATQSPAPAGDEAGGGAEA